MHEMTTLPSRSKRAERCAVGGDLALALVVTGLAAAVVYDAWLDIFRLGMVDEELSYVLVAPVVVGLLAWVRRREWHSCRIRHGWFGLLVIAAAWGTYWYGYLADPVLWRSGAVMMAVGAFIAVAGIDVLLRFAPAFAGTIFLVPISPFGRYQIAVPLQTATARATQWACDALGIYVDRFGSMLTINGVDVTVAEACNGMRMVLTLFLTCYVVAFVLPLRGYVRVLILVASPLVAVAANVLRLVPTMWMFGHASNTAAEAFHTLSGWCMTGVAFLLLMGVFRLLRWCRVPVDIEAAAS